MAIGDIGAAINDSLSLLNGCSRTRGDLAWGTGNFMVAVFSEDTSATLTMVSFEVDDCGNIPASVQDTFTVSTATGSNSDPHIINIADGYVCVGWDDDDVCTPRARISTFSIDACGNFGACDPIDTLDVSGVASSFQVSVHKTKYSASDDIYVVLWRDSASDIHMTTVTISSVGVIDNCIIEDLQVVTTNVGFGDFCITGQGDYHAVVYTGSASDGFAETYTIDSTGNISTVADTFEFDTQNGQTVSCDTMGDGSFLVFYEKSSSQGRIRVIAVDACGQMTTQSSLDAGSNTSDTTDIIRIDEAGKHIFLAVSNSAVRSVAVDACDTATQIDVLGSILELNDQSHIALRPGLTAYAVFVGWKIGTTDFFATTIAVEVIPTSTDANPQFMGAGNAARLFAAGIL